MKRNLLILALLLTGAFVSAQTRLGIKTGLALASVTTNDASVNNNKANLGSLQMGLIVDNKLCSKLSIQTQLLFLGKGTALSHDDHTDKIRFTSVDVPVQLLYRTKPGWFIGGGPNLGFNLSAHSVYEGDKQEIAIGSAAGQLRGFDFGVCATGGFQGKKGLVLSVNYVKGLSNLQNVANSEWNNNVIGLSLGYMLPARSKK